MLGLVKLVAWGGMGSEVWDFHFLKGFVFKDSENVLAREVTLFSHCKGLVFRVG
jgi:hypothetical protein